MANAEMAQPMVPLRDDYWHVVAVLPASLILIMLSAAVGIESGVFYLIQLVLSMLYLLAIVRDARYVRKLGTEWQPSKWWYAFYGVLVLLSLGLYSLFVSPYYLYKRRKYVGVL